MEDKISVLELYMFLKSWIKDLADIWDNIDRISRIKSSKTYKYDRNLIFKLYQIIIEKDISTRIIIEYRYYQNKDKFGAFISEKFEISIDEKNNLRIRPLEMVNYIANLEYLPLSRLNSSLSQIFNMNDIKKVLTTLNNSKSEIKYNLTFKSYSMSNIDCLSDIVIENNIHKMCFSFLFIHGIIYLRYHHGSSATFDMNTINSCIPDSCIDSYINSTEFYDPVLYSMYDRKLRIAEDTYIELKDLPENIREYIRYIKSVGTENVKLKQLTNR